MSSWSSFNEGSLNTGGEIFKEKGFSIATIVVAVLLSISTAALFAELWWLKRRYLKRGLEKRLTKFFYYLHFPLLVAWVLEVVACALRIVWSQNGSFDARLNEYWLRIIAISFFQVYLILMLVYLFALSKKMKWLNMNLYDTTLLKPMFFKSSLFFTVVFAGETLVGFVIVVRIVNQFLINNGDFHKSVISFFEGWLLLAEVLILMSYFLVITQLNYWYSSLELAWEIYSLKSAVDRSYVADQGPPI